MRLFTRRGNVGIALFFGVGLLGCDDAPPEPQRAQSPSATVTRSSVLKRYGDPVIDSVVRRRVDSVTRDLALSLAGSVSRLNAVASMRASREDDEHKLTLGQFRTGIALGESHALSTPVAPQNGTRSFADLDNALEVYMPVPSHRNEYTGDQPLVVAYQLLEDENPVGFTASGERLELDVRTPPSFPVLVVVPREDDLGANTVEVGCANMSLRSGAIGTWACEKAASSIMRQRGGADGAGGFGLMMSPNAPANECLPFSGGAQPSNECAPPPPQPPPVPAGLYLTSAFLSDLHEPWTRGEPEITYMVTTVPTFGNTNDTQVSCISESPTPTSAFYLDQNNNTQTFPVPFNGWGVEHTFLNRGQIEDIEAIAFNRGDSTPDVNVAVWEDDLGSKCVLNEADVLAKITAAVGAIGQIIGTVKGFGACADEATNPSKATQIKTALKWFKSVSKVCGILKIPSNVSTVLAVFGGDDDFIGVSQQTPNPSLNANNSHVIAAASGQVGRFNLTPVSQF